MIKAIIPEYDKLMKEIKQANKDITEDYKCPDCGTYVVKETLPNWQENFYCPGCGNLWTN
jgi:predicted RNA-binding Zn-ribbon protein involved in translation (DUF1610 family)